MARWLLRVATGLVIAFLYLPIAIIALYAFNAQRTQVWPIKEFSTQWFGAAWDNASVRDALGLSIQVGVLAAGIAIILGSLAAFAIHRFRFFGREVFSLSLVLPIALPGIVTGLALNASVRTAGLSFSTATIVVGHATFCIVVVYNNVVARLRRSSRNIEEASMDLGHVPDDPDRRPRGRAARVRVVVRRDRRHNVHGGHAADPPDLDLRPHPAPGQSTADRQCGRLRPDPAINDPCLRRLAPNDGQRNGRPDLGISRHPSAGRPRWRERRRRASGSARARGKRNGSG